MVLALYNPNNDWYAIKLNQIKLHYMRVGQKVHIITSYLLVMNLWPMGSRQWHTDGRRMWICKGGWYWKINLIWLYFMRVSLSAYEIFSQNGCMAHSINGDSSLMGLFGEIETMTRIKNLDEALEKTMNPSFLVPTIGRW